MTKQRQAVLRIVVLFGLVAVIAAYLGWRRHPVNDLPPSGSTPVASKTGLPPSTQTAAIVNLRLSRDQTQSKSLANLNQIAQQSASASARANASAQATKLAQTMRGEQEADALLASHGVIAATMMDNGQADVMVAPKKLTKQQVEQMASYIEQATGLKPWDIRITPEH